MNKLIDFIRDVVNTALKKIKKFILSIFKNSPAIITMVLATCGATGLLSMLPIEAMFVSTWFISEAMVVPIISIGIIYILAWLAGKSYDATTLSM